MKNIQKATFGGGCFWCIEAVIQRLNGVEKVESGYAGGNEDHANYKAVCSGMTDHAEVVQVTFDADIIPYETLITIFMTSHDPTTLNRQGADRGTQYRSIVLPHNDEQMEIVTKVMEVMNSVYDNAVTTEVSHLEKFYTAEVYHQNYYNQNSNAGYCRVVIAPKVAKLRKMYSEYMKPELTNA